MKPTRRLLAASLLLVLAGVPLGAAAQAKASSEAARPAGCSANLKGSAPMKVKLTTSMGAITIELNKEKAPISAENFAKYVDAGHYNGTIFHRVIDGFMIQGGGFAKDMKERSPQAPIKNEAANGLKNDAYTLAMARTGVRDSATAQFFINVKANDFLNYRDESPQGWGYAVFGKVIEGQDVVDKIRKVATGNAGMHQNVPLEPVVIEKAECI
ncbi:MAG: peptidyl-prolyl cis-trans isomerase [Betaproteobacteria bacterium]|nr:peptidyl-prolyl cis-trans isomerase [Betaproteobacteria bacterium]